MAKLKTKLLILAVLGVVLAVFYPKIKSAYGKHIKPHADIAASFVKFIKDFHIFGYHIPWKYVLPGFALFLAVQLFRVSITLCIIMVQTFFFACTSSLSLLILDLKLIKLLLPISNSIYLGKVLDFFLSLRVLSVNVYCVDLQKVPQMLMYK